MAETIVTGVVLAVIIALIVTNPTGDSAVLGGVTNLSSGTINAIGGIKGK